MKICLGSTSSRHSVVASAGAGPQRHLAHVLLGRGRDLAVGRAAHDQRGGGLRYARVAGDVLAGQTVAGRSGWLPPPAPAAGHGLQEAVELVPATLAAPASAAQVGQRLLRGDVRLSGDTRDGTGRPGVPVTMDVPSKAMRLTLVFDRDTYTLLGETTYTLPRNPYNLPAGTRLGWTAYVRTAVVDGIRERP
jgi:hypothetical protein